MAAALFEHSTVAGKFGQMAHFFPFFMNWPPCALSKGRKHCPGAGLTLVRPCLSQRSIMLPWGWGEGEEAREKELICLVSVYNVSSQAVSGSWTFSNPDRRHYCLIRNETNRVCACRLAAGRRARVAISIVLPR